MGLRCVSQEGQTTRRGSLVRWFVRSFVVLKTTLKKLGETFPECVLCGRNTKGAYKRTIVSDLSNLITISHHLISSHLISSHLISSHLISSHLISSHLPQYIARTVVALYLWVLVEVLGVRASLGAFEA